MSCSRSGAALLCDEAMLLCAEIRNAANVKVDVKLVRSYQIQGISSSSHGCRVRQGCRVQAGTDEQMGTACVVSSEVCHGRPSVSYLCESIAPASLFCSDDMALGRCSRKEQQRNKAPA